MPDKTPQPIAPIARTDWLPLDTNVMRASSGATVTGFVDALGKVGNLRRVTRVLRFKLGAGQQSSMCTFDVMLSDPIAADDLADAVAKQFADYAAKPGF